MIQVSLRRAQASSASRRALGLAGMAVTAVPVDAEGDVAAGVQIAAGAKLAVVTPGQQAPLGMTMSLPAHNRWILRCARSGDPRASAWTDGSLDRGSRLSAHSRRTRPGWRGCNSCPG